MESAAASVAAARGVSLPMPSSQSSRKEWRAVSEHPARNPGNEVQQPADVDFCSITIDGSLDNDILQQRLHSVVKQKEELQQIETELSAQLIARSEIIGLQNTYDSKIKEHANANVKLQEQLREREQTIHELERKIEEGQRELHAIRLETEAVWAKDDLLREQNKELANFRRERENSEAERAQHLKQIHDFQEHVQEKERQFVELQDQNRVAQETLIFKDDQLREMQTWITRVQEMDALQTIQTLQAELRERAEQYNQFWMFYQRQYAEFVQTIQMLQFELLDARERNGSNSDESHASQTNLKDTSQFGQSNGGHPDVSGNGKSGNSGGVPNGNVQNVSSLGSTVNISAQTNHVPAVPIAMPATYLPTGQVAPALHPFVIHQQVPQSHAGHFHSVPAVSSNQHWQNDQAVSDSSQMPMHNQQYPPPQNESNLLRPDSSYEYIMSLNGQPLHPEYMDAHISQGLEPHAVVPSSLNEEGGQVLESIDKGYVVDSQPQHNFEQVSSQFQDALKLDSLDHKSETEEKNVDSLSDHGVDAQVPISAANISDAPVNTVNLSEKTIMTTAGGTLPPEAFVSVGTKTSLIAGKSSESALRDKGSLLGCIVRTIPPNGRIRISSTLPNRLGKMLAPLHWHDYKRTYGKLDDFVAGHPELFVIEGDYIQLREGAQETIAATAAVAKVKAAASATSSYSSMLPSVAVTPMAQSHRLKKAPSIDSKPKDHLEQHNNGPETRPGQSADGSNLVGSQSRSSIQGGANNANFAVKQQGRAIGTSSSSRR